MSEQTEQLAKAVEALAAKVDALAERMSKSNRSEGAQGPQEIAADAAEATDAITTLMNTASGAPEAAAVALATINDDNTAQIVTGLAGYVKQHRDEVHAKKAQDDAFENVRAGLSIEAATDPSTWPGFLQAANTQGQLNCVVRDLNHQLSAHIASLPRGGDHGAVTTNTGMNFILIQLVELLRFSPKIAANPHYVKAVNCIQTENLIASLAAAKPPIDKDAATFLRSAAQGKGLTALQLASIKSANDVQKFLKGNH